MQLQRAEVVFSSITWLEECPSTNEYLSADGASRGDSRADSRGDSRADTQKLADFALVVTANQTSGRGRLGRGWVTPPGKALATSILLKRERRADLPVTWLPLLAGTALAMSLSAFTDAAHSIAVKWPNDVHVHSVGEEGLGRKLCGVLCEMRPDGSVIVGAGINVLQNEDELPEERGISLKLAGLESAGFDITDAERLDQGAGIEVADRILATYGTELKKLVSLAQQSPKEAMAKVRANTATIGTRVRVEMPAGETLTGLAVDLAPDGALIVENDAGERTPVNAGDVQHLR